MYIWICYMLDWPVTHGKFFSSSVLIFSTRLWVVWGQALVLSSVRFWHLIQTLGFFFFNLRLSHHRDHGLSWWACLIFAEHSVVHPALSYLSAPHQGWCFYYSLFSPLIFWKRTWVSESAFPKVTEVSVGPPSRTQISNDALKKHLKKIWFKLPSTIFKCIVQ